MKLRLICLFALALLAFNLPAMAEDDPQPITGTYTNTSFSYTNTFGRYWIINMRMTGQWTAGGRIEILRAGTTRFELLRSTTATNTISYEADLTEFIERLDVIRFFNTGAANETNSYQIILSNSRK